MLATSLAVSTTSDTSFIESLFSTQIGATLSVSSALITVFAALLLGFMISLVYMFTQRKNGYESSFVITLIMVPAIISIIILLVGNNLARAFSLAGAFSLIRYRSEPGSPREIAYIFFALAIGLSCGIGYVLYAALFCVVLSLAMIVLSFIRFGETKAKNMRLKVLIPENLNFDGVIDDILRDNTLYWNLVTVKTTDFGTMYELVYKIRLKNEVNSKDFLDKIRERNGNMNVTLNLVPNEVK